MRKWYKTIIILASIGAFAMAVLPIVSVRVEGELVSVVSIVRGYNLMDFSPWGVIPLMASLLIPLILFGKQSQTVKEAELLLLLVANMVCYVHSVHLAADFLRATGASLLKYYPNLFLYPFGFVGVFMLARTLLSESESEEEDDELESGRAEQ